MPSSSLVSWLVLVKADGLDGALALNLYFLIVPPKAWLEETIDMVVVVQGRVGGLTPFILVRISIRVSLKSCGVYMGAH